MKVLAVSRARFPATPYARQEVSPMDPNLMFVALILISVVVIAALCRF